jgi:hypothetical protein
LSVESVQLSVTVLPFVTAAVTFVGCRRDGVRARGGRELLERRRARSGRAGDRAGTVHEMVDSFVPIHKPRDSAPSARVTSAGSVNVYVAV